jgi:hypothetical protein
MQSFRRSLTIGLGALSLVGALTCGPLRAEPATPTPVPVTPPIPTPVELTLPRAADIVFQPVDSGDERVYCAIGASPTLWAFQLTCVPVPTGCLTGPPPPPPTGTVPQGSGTK